MTYTDTQLQALISELATSLGYERPPAHILPEEVAQLGIATESTLSVWRSTGRYNLPYVKMSRRVQYRLSDIAKHMLKRTVTHSGELA